MKITYHKGAPSLKSVRDLLGDLHGVEFGYYSHYFPSVTFSGRHGNESLEKAQVMLSEAGVEISKISLGDHGSMRNGTIHLKRRDSGKDNGN